jgi:hypothetical protein
MSVVQKLIYARFGLGVLVACREPSPASDLRTASPDAVPVAPAPAADAAAPAADAAAPATLDAALAELRTAGFVAAAETIARRVAQPRPKMKLSRSEALTAALALLEHGPRFRVLHDVMPRSTVELARAVRDRDLPIDEAERIAIYLVEVVRALDFARLATFDENHSHVTGRDWPQIDYTGEGMTWQSQKADWQPRGVTDFRTVTSIHAYFVGAEKLPHWRKVYRPRGKMSSVKR